MTGIGWLGISGCGIAGMAQKNNNHLWGVVDDDGLLEVPPQDVQVLDVVAIDTDTVFSKKSELDPFSLRIQQIH